MARVRVVLAAAAVLAVGVLSGCGVSWEDRPGGAGGSSSRPSTSTSVLPSPEATPPVEASSPAPTSTVSSPAALPAPTASPSPSRSATPTPEPSVAPPTPEPTTQPEPAAPAEPRATLRPGDRGDDVRAMQQRLADLGYWLGSPDGTWGHLTTQAVYALQKAAGLQRDGVAGPATRTALANGIRPQARDGRNGVEIDLARQLLLVVRDGQVTLILNTSTGSNKPYTEVYEGRTYTGPSVTPKGSFSVFREVDREDKGPLGSLWRPKYFNGGIAVHGSASIPPYPASHGCARLSNAAMNMIWAQGLMPIGSRVTVY